jgi:hypothetical protein
MIMLNRHGRACPGHDGRAAETEKKFLKYQNIRKGAKPLKSPDLEEQIQIPKAHASSRKQANES